jgi:hypothetical protein
MKNIMNFFQKFEVGYIQTCTSLENNTIITTILGFSKYAHWLNYFFWPNNMYVLTRGQSTKWHGYVLINQFDYDDWFDHMSNSRLVKFDLEKTTSVKRTML